MEVIDPASRSTPFKTVTGTVLSTDVTDGIRLIRVQP